ncbi:hypothetical protein A2783_01440 [Microgenomates group bacterium RIFCSPHIGHO2_01_FULL_45_11]|nr:MAG: hypothetical protein A2783_01440 [Microgenomates group bacterium RIFCSPHIGHO2_01_FULL_45_11]
MGENGQESDVERTPHPIDVEGDDVVGDEFGDEKGTPEGEDDERPTDEAGKNFQETLGFGRVGFDPVLEIIGHSNRIQLILLRRLVDDYGWVSKLQVTKRFGG